MMQSTGIKRQLLKNVYGEDLDGFCKKHIKEILTKCDALENENGPLSTAALSVVQDSLDVVQALDKFQIKVYNEIAQAV